MPITSNPLSYKISYEIKFNRKSIGYWHSENGYWEDWQDNNSSYSSLDECLDAVFEIYGYDSKYEFADWLNHVKIIAIVN